MLGLFVVGRLARRYNIRVQLRHSSFGGVTALVMLPSSVVLPLGPQHAAPPGRFAGAPELAAPGIAPEPVMAEPLPIFERARSDWFEAGAPVPTTPYPPLSATMPAEEQVQPPAGRAREFRTSVRPPMPEAPSFPSRPGPAHEQDPFSDWQEGPPPDPPAAVPFGSHDEGAPVERPWSEPRDRAWSKPGEHAWPEPGEHAWPEPGENAWPVPPQRAWLDPGERAQPEPTARAQPEPTARAWSDPSARARSDPREPVWPEPGERRRAEPGHRTGAEQHQTTAGLPRRVPRANLAPGILTQRERAMREENDAPRAARSPEDVRSLLANYRDGLERGRRSVGEGMEGETAGWDAVMGNEHDEPG
jgi:hypothetical protein